MKTEVQYPNPIRWCLPYLLALSLVISGLVAPASAQESEAEAILERASETMLGLDSFHFLFTTPSGKTLLEDAVELTRVEGDVQRPDKFRAEFTIDLAFITLSLSAIGIGTDLWVQNPMAAEGEGDFIHISGGAMSEEGIPPLALLNPDVLVRAALDRIEDATIAGEEEIDGQPTRRVEGIFDARSMISPATPGAETADELEPVEIMFWIDEEDRVVRMELNGAILPAEQGTGRIIRRVELSAFNEPVEISEPETATTE